MSTFYTRQIACPGCRAPIDAWLARGVHATRRTDLRDEIFARTFHRCTCAACDARLEIEQHLVYTDFDLHHWIYVATERDRPEWPQWEARLRSDVAHVFSDHSPLVHGVGDLLRSRVVVGYEELREKLVLWRAGLDDALVECIKVRALADEPALATAGSRLVVDRVEPDDRLVLLWFADGAATDPQREIALRSSWLADTDRDRASLMSRFDELFHGGYVSFRRILDATNRRRAFPSDADRT